jgi:serine protease inhibitor
MGMPTAMAPSSSFMMVVDRPFLFAIHGANPRDLLFIGIVRSL